MPNPGHLVNKLWYIHAMTLRKARLSLAAGHYERQEMVVSDLKNMQVSRQGIEYPVL